MAWLAMVPPGSHAAMPLAGALTAPNAPAPGRYLSVARSMLSQGAPKDQVLNLVSLECPLGQGPADPTCEQAYVLALQANASANPPGDRDDEPAAWTGAEGRPRFAERNAQWIEWLDAMGTHAAFDHYRMSAVSFYLGMGQPLRALRVLEVLLGRLPSLDASLAQRVRYARLSALLETAQDEQADAAAGDIQQADGHVDPEVLRYMASHWLARDPSRLQAWRSILTGATPDVLPLLDWRLDPASHPQPAADVACCASPRFLEPNLAWLADARLRLLHGQALPDLRRVMQAGDRLLMAWPRGGIAAAQWWQIQNGAWVDLQSVQALPEDDEALWRIAEEAKPLSEEQRARLRDLGWGDAPDGLAVQQIFLHLASHARDDKLRLRALQSAGVGEDNPLFLYRLVAYDPALLRGIAGTDLPFALLREAARQSRIPAPDAGEHLRLGIQLSALCPDLQVPASPEERSLHDGIRAQQERIRALLILGQHDAAGRIALHDLQSVAERPDLDDGWKQRSLSSAVEVRRSLRRDGNGSAARAFTSQVRATLTPGMATPAQRREWDD